MPEGFVYLWTNNINGKMYIGFHCGSKKSYTASGVAIRRAFNRHGVENFSRTILYEGPLYREEEENLLLLVDAASNDWFYNLKNSSVGFDAGKNNPKYGVKLVGPLNPMYGRSHSPESKEKQRLASLNMSDETKAKMSKSMMGRKAPNLGKKHSPETIELFRSLKLGENNPMYGKKHSEKTIDRMRKSHTGRKMTYEVRKCVYCDKEGKGPNMTRYHFENCKTKGHNGT